MSLLNIAFKTSSLMQTKDLIISGLIGGIISVILYPIFVFFAMRLLNRWRILILLDNADTYKSLRIKNSGWATLKNVIVYVTIDNSKEDIMESSQLEVFCHDQVIDDRLSWSKNVDKKNQSDIDINQGKSKKLNV